MPTRQYFGKSSRGCCQPLELVVLKIEIQSLEFRGNEVTMTNDCQTELMTRTQISLQGLARVVCMVFISGLVVSGCSTTHSGFSTRNPVPSRLTAEQANEVTLMAIGLVGTPYRYGGNTPTGGFDCSGLIGYVYKHRAEVLPPRSVSGLVEWGTPVSPDDVQTGDLAIFGQGGSATHAGIYVGEGRFVHAPSTGGEVRLDQLKSKYWSSQQVAFRRP